MAKSLSLNPKKMEESKPSVLYGINPVLEAIKVGKRRCHKIVVKEKHSNARIESVLELARSRHVKIATLSQKEFQHQYGNYAHQNIIGYFSPRKVLELNDLIGQALEAEPTPALVLLDGVQDPQNLGAIIRAAQTLGIQGVVLPARRSAQLSETVAKCSAGAVERLSIASVNNLVDALERLKKAGFWIVGVDACGETMLSEFKFDMPVALVMGGEEKGIRPLLRKNCDFTVNIPMVGTLDSLNVATASAVVFYEILRQKKNGEKP
ncbi:23S rRNA (guanosine(2251)-2'-O)-methyltransferase [hydrothermal vent metagenome]|uniref:23S rRNA (Guanosine(2251)-2'-O)-methyltransferase n=1 Tax=hydrothermal vent metagenome TaxID=652676 RepID=A0A3B1DSB1_9ZZZZ